MKGFTIVEVMVTMALTSIIITFAYSTLGYIQKLFYTYKDQNRFINEYTDFKKRMDHEALYSESVIEGSENKFNIKRDTSLAELEFLEKVVLFKKGEHCDTFHFELKQINKEYELMKNPALVNKLIKAMSFEIDYSKQKFNFIFNKNYDASVKLRLDRAE